MAGGVADGNRHGHGTAKTRFLAVKRFAARPSRSGLVAGLVTVALAMAILLSGIACSAGGRTQPSDFSGQNLLLITIDTLRPDRLGAYGFTGAATPRLDELSHGGVRFETCYSQVPLTLPSHSTLMTGRLPFSHGVRNNGVNELAASEQTLAEIFAQQGYATSAIVAAYVLLSRFGLAQGFASYDDALGGDLLQGFKSELHADEIYRKFQRWLHGRRAGKFFAWVHFYDPHLPYEPPPDLGDRFAADPYSGEVAAVDRAVGKIIDDLRAAGLLEQTLVVVTSDHGEAFGEHGEHGHSIFGYEQNLRVPLIFYAPGRLTPERLVSDRVRLVDLMPTLLELFRLPAPTAIDGHSFGDLLRGERRKRPDDVYFESFAGQLEKNWAPVQGLIVGERKYVSLPEPELYDLGADPGESENLFARERRSAHELDEALRALLIAAAGRAAGSERALDTEDTEHLTALGYLSPAAQRASKVLDPKRGIIIDHSLGEIEAALAEGESARAGAQLDRLVSENPDVEMPAFFELRSRIAKARGDRAAAIAALEQGRG
ncbi:MAG: sulfatase-like hydrolase/transferase [Thermoanaerobaculia bacterium]|nr:sulfatase-like hydrolase/transferase [Thermoanaerobaculia bacterium]